MITIVGSANMDLIARVRRLPAPGETVLSSGLLQAPGGKGANQAVAAARAGSRVDFVGRVGDDLFGAELTANLRRSGVSTDHVTVTPGSPTGLALIAVDDQSENSIVVVPGANALLQVEDIDQARETIAGSDIVVLQLEIPLSVVSRAIEIAHEGKATVVLNPAPAGGLDPGVLGNVDILVPNQEELARLSGLGSPADPETAANLLLGLGVRGVVVTLAADGALVVTADGSTAIPAFPARAVDTTGAGDAFVGNLAHALDSGQSLEEAARFAAAAAALSVQTEGAQPSMPYRNATEALLS